MTQNKLSKLFITTERTRKRKSLSVVQFINVIGEIIKQCRNKRKKYYEEICTFSDDIVLMTDLKS